MDAEIKRMKRLINVLMDEKRSFWDYKKLATKETDAACRAKFINMMEDKIGHYDSMFKILFPSDMKVVPGTLEMLFKDMLWDECGAMRAALESMKMHQD